MSRRRIGGIATASVASDLNAASTCSIASRSSGTSLRNCACPSNTVDLSMLDMSSGCSNQAAMRFDIDVAAAHDDDDRAALHLDRPIEQRGHADRRRAFDDEPFFAIGM